MKYFVYKTITGMKKFLTILSLSINIFIVNAQLVSPELISASGDYFENTNSSISFSIGEIATETFHNTFNYITQGFQQPAVLLNLQPSALIPGPLL